AAAMTALIPGAGPPPTRIAKVFTVAPPGSLATPHVVSERPPHGGEADLPPEDRLTPEPTNVGHVNSPRRPADETRHVDNREHGQLVWFEEVRLPDPQARRAWRMPQRPSMRATAIGTGCHRRSIRSVPPPAAAIQTHGAKRGAADCKRSPQSP